MLSPPVVMTRGRPVGGAFDVAVIGLSVLARPTAAPPVTSILIHLVMERVVYLDRGRICSTQYTSQQC